MKVLFVLMIIVLGIGCKQKSAPPPPKEKTFSLTKETIMLIFTLGHSKGYNAALKRIEVGKYGLTFADSPNHLQQRAVDSTEFANTFYK